MSGKNGKKAALKRWSNGSGRELDDHQGYVTYGSDFEDSSDDESWDIEAKGDKRTTLPLEIKEEATDGGINAGTGANTSRKLEVFSLLAESNNQVVKSNHDVAGSNKLVALVLKDALVGPPKQEGQGTGHSSNSMRKLERENKQLKHDIQSLKDDLIRSLRNSAGLDPRYGGSERPDDDDKIKDIVMGAIVKRKLNVQLCDVAGLEQAKEAVEEAFILPIDHPELFAGGPQPYKSLLFYGPPGTGKTLLAKAVASETDAVFFSISPSVVASKWYGESEKIIRGMFDQARQSKDSHFVIFIDEMDALCGNRDEGSDTIPRNIVSEILLQIDGITSDDDNLVLIGATNRPWHLDPAILQRMEKRIYIPLPNKDARVELIQLHLSCKTNLKRSDFVKLGDLTDGASGRDIRGLVKRALMEPIRFCKKARRFHPVKGFYIPCIDSSHCRHCRCKHCSRSKDDKCKTCGTKFCQMGDFPPGNLKVHKLCVADFESAMGGWRTTVEDDDIDKYVKWTRNFGEDGV